MHKAGEQISHYTIISAIGAGGMGQVFLAKDEKLGRRAALKFLSPEFSSDLEHRNRFVREARSSSILNHPNICTVYEIDDSDEEPFIAMEYVEGETLAAMVGRRRRGLLQSLEIAIQAADAIAEAHAHGVIHRDIKPANIIIDRKNRVKVLDFGLAKQTLLDGSADEHQFETNAGVVLGTASYMSPEQARGIGVDHRSDIWSLGVCLYQMLTGQLPFPGETPSDTIAAILTRDPRRPSELVEDLPADLDEIVLRALNRNKDLRFQTAGELHAALGALNARLMNDESSFARRNETLADEVTDLFETAATDPNLALSTKNEGQHTPATPNNLPSTFTPIIGREAEIKAVASLVSAETTRLVTLTGIGGTGKTTLARAVAHRVLNNFTDGVFFIEMARLTGPDMVAAAIAQPLAIREEGAAPLLELIKQNLDGKRCLLIIDNFEQIIDAAPMIADLVGSTEKLALLVTSREILRIAAEKEYPVPPLMTPSTDELIDLEEALGNEAVMLFADRAASINAAFRLTRDNVSAVSAICRRLDGLPLAIELAAARTKVLSPASILAKLDNRLNLLSGGDRDRPERQKTMRGAILWSYELLSEKEKGVFASLGVFSGGFMLDSAEAVCVEPAVDVEEDLIDVITSLIDKSLVSQKGTSDGEPRFHMLEVVRDFALEMLETDGIAEDVRLRHAEFFVDLGEKAEPLLQGSQSSKWLERLHEEHENIRTAMAWSLENRPDLAVRLAVAVRNYWIVHNHLTEGFGWLKAAAEAVSEPPPALKFKLLNGLGLAARFRGDLTTARKAYEKGLAAGASAGDLAGSALSHRGLGLVAMQSGDFADARSHFDAGLEISRGLSDDYGIAMSQSFLGDLLRTEGRFEEAIPHLKEAVILFRSLENKTATGDGLNNLGAAMVCLGELEEAEVNFREAMRLAFSLHNRITISHSLDGLAAIALETGDVERSALLSGAADHLRDEVGYQIEPAEAGFRNSYLSRLIEEMGAGWYREFAGQSKAMSLEEVIELASETAVNKEQPISARL